MTGHQWLLLCACQTLVGLCWDRAFGDPRHWPHPARWVGTLIGWLEADLRRRGVRLRWAGLLLWAGAVGVASAVALGLLAAFVALDLLLGHVDSFGNFGFCGPVGAWPWVSMLGGGVVCGVWFSWRSLADEAAAVQEHLDHDRLPEARRALAGIVGRDTDALDEAEVARAAVETVAENSVDGGVSPTLFALLGGPVLVTLFKAASTLDSMVGYRDEHYRDLGAVSARIDDALNYVPARLTLLLVPLAARFCGGSSLGAFRIGRRDGRKHPSPNAAIGESCFAGALGVQLGGPSTYRGVRSEKPRLGDPGRSLSSNDIRRANRLLFGLWGALLVLTMLLAAVLMATLPQPFLIC